MLAEDKEIRQRLPRILIVILSFSLTIVALLWALPASNSATSPWRGRVTRLPSVSIAFVGNSITFVNDVPRLMEALSDYRVRQDSCLHGSQNLLSLVTKGNGMYKKWKTSKAYVETVNYTKTSNKNGGSSSSVSVDMYDYGACSLPQLIFGHDENLSAKNANGFYVDDGNNPCFKNSYYLRYLQDKFQAGGSVAPKWDYVVMNDQTKYPALFLKRRTSLLALKEVYLPIFLESGARPVFIVTHGYRVNSTRLGDIPQFTSHLWYGYQLYAKEIKDSLPSHQRPLLVPSGLAFLTVYEENYEMWERLFYVDGCKCIAFVVA
jgi:hypothetical protein